MNNEIKINPDEIRKLPNNSIEDNETIRQIGLYSSKTGDCSLNLKIKSGFEYIGLYPHIMKILDIKPDKLRILKTVTRL